MLPPARASRQILEKLDRDEEAVATMEEAHALVASARDADDPIVNGAQRNVAGLKAHLKRKAARRPAAVAPSLSATAEREL